MICSKCQLLLTPILLQDDSDDDLTSCSTSESSTTHVITRKRRREVITDHLAIVEIWCGSMHLNAYAKLMVVRIARGLRWNELSSNIPLCVSVAAMILRGLKVLGFFSGPVWPQNLWLLYKLAEMAGAPAGMILDAESMLHKTAKTVKQHRRRKLLQEGWDEC